MSKLKLKMWTCNSKKMEIKVKDKVIKLKEERELLGRFLIIMDSRPNLVPQLSDTIGNYEMSVVPRSLCEVDGSLQIPKDKSSLMHAVLKYPESSITEPALPAIHTSKTLIIDAMEELQSITKTPKMKKISDLQEIFIKRVEKKANEGHFEKLVVIFDQYREQSLKNKTRSKRAQSASVYSVHEEMSLTMSIKELLSASETKKKLTILIGQATKKHFMDKNIKAIVIYDNQILRESDSIELHGHEEADTLIPHQVLEAHYSGSKEISVSSPDTDVLILLLDVVATGKIGNETRLTFVTGKGCHRKKIDVNERVQAIGMEKCAGLIGFHNFTGADWGGKFVGISKKTWCNLYFGLPADSPILNVFKQLGEIEIPEQLIEGNLPHSIAALELFVCQAYSKNGPNNIPGLRWEMFRTKNLEGEMLPPTRASLLPHILRSNYISSKDKSYKETRPTLPPKERNGWNYKDGEYSPVMCLELPAPQAIIELIKCGCKTCETKGCGCKKNGLPCTPLCKCNSNLCMNQIMRSSNDSEDEDDQE